MKNIIVLAVAASAAGFAMPALAQKTDPDPSSIAGKEMQVQGVSKGGTTDVPVTKADPTTLSGKIQSDLPGTTGGSTAAPVAGEPVPNPKPSAAIKDPNGSTGGKN